MAIGSSPFSAMFSCQDSLATGADIHAIDMRGSSCKRCDAEAPCIGKYIQNAAIRGKMPWTSLRISLWSRNHPVFCPFSRSTLKPKPIFADHQV